ncbi:protein takeout-like [Periplaneta americana]|uniref:protein takeout-like n=1 Tax=Periplaneta americana TaxID=6978 RepID=UPI0037E9C7FF
MWRQSVVLFLVGVAYAAMPLPPYLKPCARSDPNFNACALKHGREAVDSLVKGDKNYKIPNLNPITIRQIKVKQGPSQAGYELTLNDVKVHGVDGVSVEKTDFDFDKQHIAIELKFPALYILCKYDISGRILVLPIRGNGDANLTMVDNNLEFSVDYTLQEKDGNTHLVITKSQAVLKPRRVYIHLSNLFNGDKFLGNQMNEFMNENWRDVFKEMSPEISKNMAEIISNVVNNISSLLTFDSLFPEKLP